mgnify:CR=1 FL=1
MIFLTTVPEKLFMFFLTTVSDIYFDIVRIAVFFIYILSILIFRSASCSEYRVIVFTLT